jgi:PAS domain S-box-containing protein
VVKRAKQQTNSLLEYRQIIGDLLQLALTPQSLIELLQQALNLLLSVSWVAIQNKGAIFLTDNLDEELHMVAQSGIAKEIVQICSKVKKGNCLCGRVALSKEILFADHIDERHDIFFEGMEAHGHYVVPILMDERLLGVLTLYIEEGHKDSVDERKFLTNFSRTLAGIIIHKQLEAKKNETLQKLQESQANLLKVQEIAHLGNWNWNITSSTLDWSDEVYRIFGLQPKQFVATNQKFLDIIHADDRNKVTNAVESAIANTEFEYQVEHRILRPDGTQRIVEERCNIVRNKSGEPIIILGTVLDITERKDAEQKLLLAFEKIQVNEVHLRSILDNALDAIITIDHTGKIKEFNRAAENLFGYSAKEIMAKDWADLIIPEDLRSNYRDALSHLYRKRIAYYYLYMTVFNQLV